MTGRTGPLLLLDAPSLYFRAFYGVPESVRSPDGEPVNAVRGLLDMLAHLIATRRPARLVAAMDADWRPAFRVAALPAYKAHRVAADGGETVPAALVPQVPVIAAVLTAVGIPVVGSPGFEADDVIGTLAERGPGPVEIVTGDRDLFQLIRDDVPVRVLYVAKGVRNLEVVGEARIEERYGVPGRRYGDFAVLRGDPSDGLPGVAGVGAKTAAELVNRCGGVADVLAALDAAAGPDETAAQRATRQLGSALARLAAARDYLRAAQVVVGVVRDVPVPELPDALPRRPESPDRLVELSTRWGLDSSLNRLLAVLT